MSTSSIYLVAYYMMKPKHSRINTSIKGWMNDPNNVAYDEQIAVVTKLKNKDLNTAKVILNLSNCSVYRNNWSDNKSFNELFEHFYAGYQKYLDPVIAQLGYEMVKNDEPLEVSADELPKNETISSA